MCGTQGITTENNENTMNKDIKIQDLADKLTTETLTAIYGKRFTSLYDVEDDAEIDKAWTILNARFYSDIFNFINY